jgi:hypothetical protein
VLVGVAEEVGKGRAEELKDEGVIVAFLTEP